MSGEATKFFRGSVRFEVSGETWDALVAAVDTQLGVFGWDAYVVDLLVSPLTESMGGGTGLWVAEVSAVRDESGGPF